MCVQSVSASGSNISIATLRNIDRCYYKCRSKKRNTFNALRYEFNAEENNLKLKHELENRTYHPSPSILFAAKKPKLREIFAAPFKDRIVHHILVSELEKIWEKIFIHDSYACRDGKGTHSAKERLHKFTRQITKNGNIQAYYLQLDIKDFFTSIDKEILFSLLRKKIENPEVLWLAENILFWDCTKSYIRRGDPQLLFNIPQNKTLFGKNNQRGLPIGNLTSQFFANIYLNELDQFVKHVLKAHYYLRYVDDFVILSPDASQLRVWQAQIEEFLLSKLNLRLHPKRRKLAPISNGIDFLGYIVRPNYILVRRRVVNNLREKLKEFKNLPEKFKASVSSYLGHFKHANSFRLRLEIINKI